MVRQYRGIILWETLMHTHQHWALHEERIAWNALSRTLMHVGVFSPDAIDKVVQLSKKAGQADNEMGEKDGYEEGLVDSRYCLLNIVSTYDEEQREAPKMMVNNLFKECLNAYENAYKGFFSTPTMS